jgi:hypothetical protein
VNGRHPQELAATLRQAGRKLVRRARVVPDVDERSNWPFTMNGHVIALTANMCAIRATSSGG